MIRALSLLVALWAAPAHAVTCSNQTVAGTSFAICEVDPTTEDLRLFLRNPEGEILGTFRSIETQTNRDLAFAMNAGMFHDDRRPVGHYVENGAEEMRVVSNAGPGNFGLLPNGVFCISEGRALVIETLRYLDEAPHCAFATQSGPMLVIDGDLHPRFIPGGSSRLIRNGVGTNSAGTRAVFAISNEPVNFHDFGTLFRDHLGLEQALYFDGNVSRLYAPEIGRNDFGQLLGPMVGVLKPQS